MFTTPAGLAAGAPVLIPATGVEAGAEVAAGAQASPNQPAPKPMGWKETTTATIRPANPGSMEV
ncbi:hypothetical protein A3J33_02300 [candidate division WWE3 bacterium RIFCSPLOWO2_02_FULL_53_10]|uniref:Uncharacterized protein n=1 Tax=candidate division WWE3 bacterium RIFCSPLOWO2_02_FULL_53_10 TaxID=1802629 RepID=A0A1F4WBC8_UNCKA|nr:MAG: hypothetical protein A3J33_02300 [candidate division WWE3 bacterium RIFCSPLOWO2_02_FULL_53_10]